MSSFRWARRLGQLDRHQVKIQKQVLPDKTRCRISTLANVGMAMDSIVLSAHASPGLSPLCVNSSKEVKFSYIERKRVQKQRCRTLGISH